MNYFAEYVAKDDKGRKIVQDAIHEEIQNHIDECQKRGLKNCGVLAPWGHGKTEQILFRILKYIGEDTNRRIQLICNTDENAKARVNTLSRYIEYDPDYKRVFPNVKPGEKHSDDWGKHKLVVQRSSFSKDGTVEAWGVITSGTGSRADIQIFDDVVDLRNAILNPALREQVKFSLNNVWFSRLVPDGFRIYIATVWHDDDATSQLRKNSEWNFLVMRVSEDFKSIECESSFKGKYNIPLWRVWNESALKKQYRDIGSRAFDRGYRQKALNDEDRTFPSSDSIFNRSYSVSSIPKDWPCVTGIDPFGKKVVIFTIALHPITRQRHVKEIKVLKTKPKQTILELIDTHHRLQPQVLVVENNAAQVAIADWAKEIGGLDIPIIPFTTGSQKVDPEIGLPSLEVEFSNGAWICPMEGVDETDSEHPFNIWKYELRSHPVGEAEDSVMASWFAREGARFLEKLAYEEAHPQNDVVTQEEVLEGEDGGEFERVQIGDY